VADHEQLLYRGLTRWHALAVVVGSIVGTGIYIRPASIAQLVVSPTLVLAVWICAGLLSLTGALTYAQLAALIPRSGGEYAFLRTTLGELPAFLFGWMRLTVSVGTCAAMAVAVTVFLSDLVPLGQPWLRLPIPWPHATVPIDIGVRQLLAVLIIVSLAALNLRGVGRAGRFQAAVTTLKVVGLLGLIAAVLAFGHAAGSSAPGPVTSAAAPGPAAFSAALLASMVAFNGWANVAMLAGEVKDAERTVPWALFWGILGVIGLYVMVNIAYLYVLPMGDILSANSAAHPTASSVASRAALTALGPKVGVLLPVLFMVSALGTLHCNLMAVPRVFYAMARDGLMPAALGRVDPTAHTPAVSIMTVAFIGALLAIVGSYDRLSSMATFGNLLFFALNAWGLIRWPVGKETSIRRGIQRYLPWIFLLGSVWLLVTVIAHGSVEIVWALVLIGAGLPVYLGIRAKRRGR
jgi:APA family basic amino acid/polyamine antiporter